MERLQHSDGRVERRGDRREGHRSGRVALDGRRDAIEDVRAAMTRVYRTRSRGLVAEFGR